MYHRLTIIFLILLFPIIFFPENVFASQTDPILITISPDMEEVIFDGKWTFFTEWKPSSLTKVSFDDKQIILRTAHFENFIYVFVDPINDLTLDEKMDEATICLDGKNNKSETHDIDDFCFSVLLGNNEGSILQGNLIDESTTSMHKISNPDDFIAISTISDENDRYTKNPHPSYEFKIPIELLERSDNYGFYLSVYDASLDKFYSWPKNSTRENSSDIPSPSKWGDIVSPDKSLPELNLPIMVFTVLIFTIILVQSKIRIGIFR